MEFRIFGIGWLLFSFIFLVYIKLLMAGSLERFFFHWDAVAWSLIESFIGAFLISLIKERFELLTENSKSIRRDFLILVAVIPLASLVTTIWGIAIVEKLMFGKSHTYYNWVMEYLYQLIIQTVVVFSCISYFYITALNKIQERLSAAQKAQSEMQLKLLQQKVDPHFLFNNLNVVSALIPKEPQIAGEFLDKLAELYRYILQTQNVEAVPLKDELLFSENYLYLIKQRFGEAFAFEWQVPVSKLNGQMIVPASLQTLLENVVKHNAGDPQNPLEVRVELDEDFLLVENELRHKSQTRPTSGTGLQNLSARYALLTDEPLRISDAGGRFKVALPLLKLKI